MNIVITCEHASFAVPYEYVNLFQGEEEILLTHKGWDEGAKHSAEALGRLMGVTPINGEVNRLLVDLNRSEGISELFSGYIKTAEAKQAILNEYYKPFRNKVLIAVSAGVPVLHISVHSFTPVLDGEMREAEIGILYDPDRESEKTCTGIIIESLKNLPYKVMENSPYEGRTDGTAAWLRKLMPDGRYTGFEIELNQKLLTDGRFPREITDALYDAFKKAAEAI